jgi:hypothetical protein
LINNFEVEEWGDLLELLLRSDSLRMALEGLRKDLAGPPEKISWDDCEARP